MTNAIKAAAAAGLLAATLGSANAAPPAAGAEIVVVDVNRVLSECAACKGANAQLQQQAQQFQTFAEGLGTPLRTEGQQLQTQYNALAGKQPDAALQGRITAFQAKQNQAQQQIEQRRTALQRNQEYARQQIGAKLQPIFTSVLNAHHAQLVVDTAATLASQANLDVTNEVLAQLNQQLPSVSVTAPAAPAAAAGADGR